MLEEEKKTDFGSYGFAEVEVLEIETFVYSQAET